MSILDLDTLKEIDSQIPEDEVLYDLADLFKIFGDTTRIKILYALREAELCVGDISELLNMNQSAVSHLSQPRAFSSRRTLFFLND